MPSWLCARCIPPMVWMMPRKNAASGGPPAKKHRMTLMMLLKRIDSLRNAYQDISKEQDNAFQDSFLKLLEDAGLCFPAMDFLCYLTPTDRRPLYINGIVRSKRYEDKRINDGFNILNVLVRDKAPLLVSGKFGDIPLRTKEGAFLALPVFDHKMDVQGGFICYTRKTDDMTDERINRLHVLAVGLSALMRHQTAGHLLSDTAQRKLHEKLAPEVKRRRKNTASYRRDVSKASLNYTPRSTHMTGTGFGNGIAIGQAVLHGAPQEIANYAAKSKKHDYAALDDAITKLIAKNEQVLSQQRAHLSQEAVDCLRMHQLLLQDPMWIEQIRHGINFGLSAAAAVEFARQKTYFTLAKVADPYIRDRFSDINDLSDKLRLALDNIDTETANTDEIILVAHNLGVSGLMEYELSTIKGIILETGSISSHITIIAGTMDIPILGQCAGAMRHVNPGDKIIIDSDQSVAFVLPEAHTLRLYKRKKAQIRQRERHLSLIGRQGDTDCTTCDGTKISLYMNAGLPSEVALMHDYGAAGIGLFRTELTFMGWTRYPSVAKQTEMYRKVLDQAGAGKPVLFRTLDIGGDKPLPYFEAPTEENPALGWRAVRIGIDRPAILRTQFSAFLQAGGHYKMPLHIMLPLVTEVEEIRHVKAILHATKERLAAKGRAVPDSVKFGIMLEVPSLLWQMDAVCREVDFIAVGTNDLMQYVFAADRGSALMHGRYEFLSPPMLRIMKHIADSCRKHGTAFSVCGEAAAQPLEAAALIALGYTRLSMPGARIPFMRSMCASLDIPLLKPYIEKLMQTEEHSLRVELHAFAQDHGIRTA